MPRIDLTGAGSIQEALKLIQGYRQHIYDIRTAFYLYFGSDVKVPAELEQEIQAVDNAVEYLSSPASNQYAYLMDRFCGILKSALLLEQDRLKERIASLKKDAATDEMIEPLIKRTKFIVDYLKLSAFHELPDTPLLTAKKFMPSLGGMSTEREMLHVTGRTVRPKTCFVVIASDKDKESNEHERRYRIAIEPGVTDSHYEPYRNVDGHHPNWFVEMVNNLWTCELAVVDLTGLRPNCIWELGVLNAWNVPVVIIHPEGLENLPSDIFTQRIAVFYDPNAPDFAKLRQDLAAKILNIMSSPHRGQFLTAVLVSSSSPNSDSVKSVSSVAEVEWGSKVLKNEGNIHNYAFRLGIKNVGTKRLDDLVVELQFPYEFLIEMPRPRPFPGLSVYEKEIDRKKYVIFDFNFNGMEEKAVRQFTTALLPSRQLWIFGTEPDNPLISRLAYFVNTDNHNRMAQYEIGCVVFVNGEKVIERKQSFNNEAFSNF